MSLLSKKLDIIGPKVLLLWLCTLSNVVPFLVNLSLCSNAFLRILLRFLFLNCRNSVHFSLCLIWRGASTLWDWATESLHWAACLQKVSLRWWMLLSTRVVTLSHEIDRWSLLLQILVVSQINSRSVTVESRNRYSKTWGWRELRGLQKTHYWVVFSSRIVIVNFLITHKLLYELLMRVVILLVVFRIIGRTVLHVVVTLEVRSLIKGLSGNDGWTEDRVDVLLGEVLSAWVVEVVVRQAYAWRLLRRDKATWSSIGVVLGSGSVVRRRHYRGLYGKILRSALRGGALHTSMNASKCR